MHQLRQTLCEHLGKTLTPELAAAIELAANIPAEQPMGLLNKWRHLIEPVIQGSSTPLPWDALKYIPVRVYEAGQSVLVVRTSKSTAFIWVAAGVLDEVLTLIERVAADAKTAGCSSVSYLGRRGWLRAAGFTDCAIFGVRRV